MNVKKISYLVVVASFPNRAILSLKLTIQGEVREEEVIKFVAAHAETKGYQGIPQIAILPCTSEEDARAVYDSLPGQKGSYQENIKTVAKLRELMPKAQILNARQPKH